MPDDVIKVGSSPPVSTFIHARNVDDSPPSGKALSCDQDGHLLVGVPGVVDVVVQNFPDPQNVNISSQDIPVEVSPRPSGSSGPSRVTVDESAAPLLSAGATRRSLVLYNDGPDTVWIGNADTVDETNGWPLLLGSSFNFGMNDNNEDMYGRCATGETALVHVWEVSY